ncbi:MAG: DsbA family protein [Actinobacteria bacterium]|nr:DsbA family protein [Actinomycetota bacterium]
MPSLIAALAVLAMVAIIVVALVRNNSSTEPVAIDGAADVAVMLQGIPQQNLILGQPDAPVTIIEFSDLKCPGCRKFSMTTLPRIITDYVRTGKVRIIFQYLTFVGEKTSPGDSEKAARFALAAGNQNRLWNFTELFYYNQQPESQRYVTDEFLTNLGNSISGLDVQRAFSESGSDAVTLELKDQGKAFSATGFSGVPFFQIGKTGAAPTNITTPSFDYTVFKNAIDGLL